ncbi:MAG: hypothetical protein L3J06_04115 [Cyclobacteriaceae bacterium]|nr:hypothetical protein [Cyclobacteriaceae bacterium]
MKNTFIIYINAIALTLVVSCSTNNPFDDLGTSDGSNLANVYIETLAPKLQAGIDKEMEVQYWSLDDNFIYTGLWDYVSRVEVFEVSVDGVVFNQSELEEFQDWTESQAYPFDFSNWVPASSAYVKKITYNIDITYDKTTVDASGISSAEFLAKLPENYEDEMYSFYTISLSRNTLNDLMLNNGIMAQEEFDSQYGENGVLTGSGQEAIESGLAQVGIETLIGVNYKIDTEYEITLAFRVTNETQKSNEYRRTFGVF